MLLFAEELLLLALDDEKGAISNISPLLLDYALAGALLMELASMDRIDTDLTDLWLVNEASTGDDLLDRTMAMLKTHPKGKDAGYWIAEIQHQLADLQEILFDRLIAKGILSRREHRLFWVFKQRRYPMIDNKQEKEVRTRIRDIILGDDIPEPRDVVLISLMNAANLSDEIFSRQELKAKRDRIFQIARMDLIGQAISRTINDIQALINSAIHMAH